MNKNTQEEKELLSELMVITDLIKGFADKKIKSTTEKENEQLNVILSKLKKAYPNVIFPNSLCFICSALLKEFIINLLPVYDRLYMQQLEAELSVVEPDVVIGSVEYNASNVNEENPFNPIGHDDVEEVKEVKKTVTRKKK